MSINFSRNLLHAVGDFDAQDFYMVSIIIKIDLSESSRFHIGAQHHSVLITDGSLEVRSIKANPSPNQKELIAYFTNDVFTQFSGNVDIEFYYGSELLGSFTNINPSTEVQALDPSLAGLGLPVADNQWLANL